MLQLLQEEITSGTPLDKIGFITHTVAAKLEAVERVQRVMKITDEKTQLKYFRTIHGICYAENDLQRANVMQPEDYLQFGNEIGIPFSANFTSEVDMDGLPIGFNMSGGNEILAVRQLAAAKGCSVSEIPEEWPNWASPGLMREVTVGYKEFKEKHAKFDFVDMLELYRGHGTPLPIDVIFIDEAQDLSSLQWAIVKKMVGKCERVYVAGDDDQMIYGFIGADKNGFIDLECDETIILPKTYRLKADIWKFAQNIIKQVDKRQDKVIEVVDKGGQIDYFNKDPLYMDIGGDHSTMVIARHHFQLQRFAKSLEVRGIPYKGRGRKVQGTDQAAAVHAYFRAKNGGHISLREAALVLRFAGDKAGVKRLREMSRDDPKRVINRWELEQSFDVNFTMNWTMYLARNPAEMDRNDLIRNILNNLGLDGLIDEPKVSLTTYHGCKGREADHVILMTDCFKAAWDHALKSPDDERRLAFVGVTRAKDRLTIIPPTTDMWIRSLI